MARFMSRMVQAALLNPELYEEVEADRSATIQAALVVVLSSLAAGIGTRGGGEAIILSLTAHVLGWLTWAILSCWIGTHLLPEPGTKTNWGELLRTLGFAASPGIIRLLGVFEPLSMIVFWIAVLWMLATMIVAIRQALDYTSTLRAVAVCGIGWLIHVLVLTLATIPAT